MFFKNNPKDAPPPLMGKTKVVPLLALRDIIVFPHMVVPLFVGRNKSIHALEEAMQSSNKEIMLSAQHRAKTNKPGPDDIYEYGTLGTIIQLLKLPDGTLKVLVEGRSRAIIKKYLPHREFFVVEVEKVEEKLLDNVELEALIRSVKTTFESYIKINKRIPQDMVHNILAINHPGKLADTITAHLTLKIKEKQNVLQIEDIQKRLEKLYSLLQAEIEIIQVEKKIRTRVKKQMEKTQKEYYLNEQIQAIQKELGEKDEFRNEIVELEEELKKKKMSAEAKEKAKKEIKKLKMMSPMSAEATVVRNYIDWILSLPWFELTDDKLDIVEAEKILDEDHYGLETVKERILEYLAVQGLAKHLKGPILCFVGPPGVGKTSLARSIARATGKNFVRLSLGGVRDEAEIRGHRRTYIGAMPGKIIQSLKKVKSSNPVFLLDEIDKMSTDFRGDPSAALMEVLDPEQNKEFSDHYMDMDYDLSKIMFLCTANTLHGIPVPLQDRMEIIRLAGYTDYEKTHIATKFLVKKQLIENGLDEIRIDFSIGALKKIIRRYTREAGVRNLERQISSIFRKIARLVLKHGKDKSYRVTEKTIPKFLGVYKFRDAKIEQKSDIGIANGLAWTEVGGELLATEVTLMPGKGIFTVTGKLGEVMKESAQAAMSYVRSRTKAIDVDKDFYQKTDVHIHVPEGAIPKDGPSAGITMATSIVSALTKIPVKYDVAMTGEITLRGRILPIGGLKEKVLAAHRCGIKTIIIPYENKKDLEEIPNSVAKDLTIKPVDCMDEVLQIALDMNKAKDNKISFIDQKSS